MESKSFAEKQSPTGGDPTRTPASKCLSWFWPGRPEIEWGRRGASGDNDTPVEQGRHLIYGKESHIISTWGDILERTLGKSQNECIRGDTWYTGNRVILFKFGWKTHTGEKLKQMLGRDDAFYSGKKVISAKNMGSSIIITITIVIIVIKLRREQLPPSPPSPSPMGSSSAPASSASASWYSLGEKNGPMEHLAAAGFEPNLFSALKPNGLTVKHIGSSWRWSWEGWWWWWWT